MDSSSRSLIPADYTLSAASVYYHALTAVVISLQSLDVLVYIASRRTLSSFRNTGTSWSKEFEEFVLSYGPHTSHTINSLQENTHPWKARSDIKILQEDKSESWVIPHPNLLVTTSDHSFVTLPSSVSSNLRTANIMPSFHVRAHLIDTVVRYSYLHTKELELVLLGDIFTIERFPWVLQCFRAGGSRLEDVDPEHLNDDNNPSGHEERINRSDLMAFHDFWMKHPNQTLFETYYSVGLVSQVSHEMYPGDAIFAVDGVSTPLILRQTSGGRYRIVSACYLWAALELDYWNPGTKKGRWGTRHYDHGCEQTQMITIT